MVHRGIYPITTKAYKVKYHNTGSRLKRTLLALFLKTRADFTVWLFSTQILGPNREKILDPSLDMLSWTSSYIQQQQQRWTVLKLLRKIKHFKLYTSVSDSSYSDIIGFSKTNLVAFQKLHLNMHNTYYT